MDAGKEVFAKQAAAHGRAEVAVRAADQLEIAGRQPVRPERVEPLLLDRRKQHGLLLHAQFADFVEKQHAAVRLAQMPRPVARRPGERPALVSEERGHRPVAADRRAVHLDELARDLAPQLLQFVDSPRELRLARAGGPGQEDRRLRVNRDVLDLVDHAVERGVARLDPGFEKRGGLALLHGEALGDAVVARQVEVDDRVAPDFAGSAAARRRRLDEPRGEVPRLGQQIHADLNDVRAGGDVDEIGLPFRIEGITAGEPVQRGVHFLEVPRVAEVHRVQAHVRLRRNETNVAGRLLRQRRSPLVAKQLQPLHQQILMLEERDGRSPPAPAIGGIPAIE
ncbi:MAG: hypothetical protein FLDDKLPJ_01641 [Phycisphaerae bacterium]|nr:hypothetical protein [Phycisphaerae bacterium]